MGMANGFITTTWTAGAAGTFSTAGDWSNGVPTSSEEADLTASGAPYTVTSSTAEDVGFLAVEADATLAVSGGVFKCNTLFT